MEAPADAGPPRRPAVGRRIKPHALRHGFITDALDVGVPLHEVQDAAGHRDPRTTQRYNRRRGCLDGHPAYTVADAKADRLEHRTEQAGAGR